jgi:hypothetical protein
MPTQPHTHTQPGACRWKRMYLDTEHARRKLVRRWEGDLNEFERGMSEYEETIRMLKEELLHTRLIQTTQFRIIEQLQKTLLNNGLAVKHSMASLTNCKAKDHEICPLSLAPINQSPLPLGEDVAPCDLVLNPTKPDHKCAQLACGHRFNAIWLIYHFIEGNTFRCPVCRAGEPHFRFQRNELPPAILKILEKMEAMKKKSAA